MADNNKPPLKGKIIRRWALVVGNIIFWTCFWFWWTSRHAAPAPAQPLPVIGEVIVFGVIGMFFLVAGVIGYVLVLVTHCLTFNFSRPVWRNMKARLYVANLLVTTVGILGVGFIASAFLTPILRQAGVSDAPARMGPILAPLCLIQVVMIWFLVWAPLETRIIRHRLLARGLTLEQMKDGICIGLSDPTIKGLKRAGIVEEDMGMLWFNPEQLIYWGDAEEWAVTRDQLAEVERRADSRSTTMLSGTQHVILHLRLADESVREVRLHTEGIFTMGGKRRAMDDLSNRIDAWRTGAG